MSNFRNYKKLLSYIGKFKYTRIFILFLCSISIVMDTLIPFLIGKLVSMVQGGDSLHLILRYSMLLILVGILSVLFNGIQNYKWHIFRVEYSNYFKTLMLKGALNKDPQYYKDNNEDLTARILTDSEMISNDISIGFPMLFLNVLRIVLVLILMVKMSIKLSIIVFFVIPIYTLFFAKIQKSLRNNSRLEREKFTNLTDNVKEYIDGIFQIKIFGKELFFLNKFKKNIKEYEKYRKNIQKYYAFQISISQFVRIMLPISILILGAVEVHSGRLILGYLFAFYYYLDFLYEPMLNLVDWFTGIQVSIGMVGRIIPFIEGESIESEGKNLSSIEDIKIDNLSFSYNNKDYIFNGFNQEFKKGDIVGIIGSSGSGKSTLLDILLKRIKNYSGNICVNGVNLQDLELKNYYDKISYLEQESFLFQGDLMENVVFDNYEENKYNNSVNLSKVDKIIKNKSENFEIDIKGKNLSGGEKQRIALSRSIYKNSNLLILDEFTSALDNETELEVVENLKELCSDKITIIITHRKLPLSICNKIIDLDNKN